MPSRSSWALGAVLMLGLGSCSAWKLPPSRAKKSANEKPVEVLPPPRSVDGTQPTPPAPSLLNPQVTSLDLCSALKLAGVYNPEILLARARVTESDAQRQLAAAQFLPTINFGTNYDQHQGTLQQSTGKIIQVNRDAMYLGLGASAVAAGTVTIPGVVLSGNVSDTIYNLLTARQIVRQRQFESEAVRNDVLLRVVTVHIWSCSAPRAGAPLPRKRVRILPKWRALPPISPRRGKANCPTRSAARPS